MIPVDSPSKVMAATRSGLSHTFEIHDVVHGGKTKGYIIANRGRDGELREVFLRGHGLDGSTLDGWTQCFAVMLSRGLQSGMDIADIAERIGATRFPPYGPTENPAIPFAPSVPAYIVVWLALTFGDEACVARARAVVAGWGS